MASVNHYNNRSIINNIRYNNKYTNVKIMVNKMHKTNYTVFSEMIVAEIIITYSSKSKRSWLGERVSLVNVITK